MAVPSSSVWLSAADAAWASRPGGASTSGHLIVDGHPNDLKGGTAPFLAAGQEHPKSTSDGEKLTPMQSVPLSPLDCNMLVCSVSCGNSCVELLQLDQRYEALLSARAAASKASEDWRLAIETSMIKTKADTT